MLCSAVTLGGIWMSRQTVVTYDAPFHKRYFYFLVFFYAFAFYALWGPVGLRELLLLRDTVPPEVVSRAVRWLPLLALPFAAIGWIVYGTLGFASGGSGSVPSWYPYYAALIGVVLPLVALSTFMLSGPGDLSLPQGTYLLKGLTVWLDIGFTSLVVAGSMKQVGRTRGNVREILSGFAWLTLLSLGVRAGALLVFSGNPWVTGPALLFYFLSAGIPFLFIYRKSDLLFQPVATQATSEEKIQRLTERYGITPREVEVIRKICEGKTNRQIASELYISLQTVKDHTHRIYSKVGINSRMKLVQLLNK